MKKAVCFAYISKENRTYIEELSTVTGQKISFCVDKILDAARTKKPLKIEKTVPQYVEKARAWSKKNSQVSA